MKYREIRSMEAINASAIANNLTVRRNGKYLRVFGAGSSTFETGWIVAKVLILFDSLDLDILMESSGVSCGVLDLWG